VSNLQVETVNGDIELSLDSSQLNLETVNRSIKAKKCSLAKKNGEVTASSVGASVEFVYFRMKFCSLRYSGPMLQAASLRMLSDD